MAIEESLKMTIFQNFLQFLPFLKNGDIQRYLLAESRKFISTVRKCPCSFEFNRISSMIQCPCSMRGIDLQVFKHSPKCFESLNQDLMMAIEDLSYGFKCYIISSDCTQYMQLNPIPYKLLYYLNRYPFFNMKLS